MTPKALTGWESANRSDDRLGRIAAHRLATRFSERLPSYYPFPIDFIDEERLPIVLGALCREAGITEAQAKVVAALLAGYGSDRLIADRIGITQRIVLNTLVKLRKRFGLKSRAHLATAFWPIYEGLRGHALLLPRVEPYELPTEAVYVRTEQTPDRGFPQQVALAYRAPRMDQSQPPPPQPQLAASTPTPQNAL